MAALSLSTSLARLSLASLLALGCFAGCSSDAPAKDEGPATTGDEQDIVDIASTSGKNQSIGNCWTYATTAWVESMHLKGTGEASNLSESWMTYWDWYEKLTGYKTANATKLETGGFFRTATTLIGKYGVVEEGAFIEAEATSDRSSAQSRAESAINASMTSGALKTSRSPEVVRRELDKAWGLSPAVIANMKATFGEAAPRAITTVPAGFKLYTADAFKIGHKDPGKPGTVTSLRSELGNWEEITPASVPDPRKFVRRVQKSLHDGQPAIIVWNVSWAARSGPTFARMSATNKVDGVHMTLLEDYQAALVPNIGTLPAGVTVTDPKILDAALADQVEVSFFRVKNSWGPGDDPTGTGKFKGYVDLYRDYLFPSDAKAPKGIVSFIVPRAYDGNQPAGLAPDLCENAPGDATGTFCGATLTGKADSRLFTCDTGYSTAVSTCSGACSGSPATCAAPTGGGGTSPSLANPCENADQGAGPYCGAALGLPAGSPEASTLYSCQKDPSSGKWISPFTSCPKGCQDGGPGAPDRCK